MESLHVYNTRAENTGENEDTLQNLLALAKKGRQSAFGQIYNLYFKKIYQFIFYRVGHKEVAEDLAEDVFLKAFSKISSVNKDSSFMGWLYQIARNRVIDYYRERKLTVTLEEVENTLEYETNVIDIVNLERQQIIFLKLLKELGTEQQTVLKLKFLENLDNTAIAEMLHKSEGAIRVIQHRAIAKLQELIKKHEQGKE
jgi:RNA polymerase sigma-70 factor (ECF subfamily)